MQLQSLMPSMDKKVLFIIGMDQEVEELLHLRLGLPQRNYKILKIYGPLISNQFDGVMRTVILEVFREGVEEIFILGSTQENDIESNYQDSVIKNLNKEAFQEKIQTMDYLLRYYFPSVKSINTHEWLVGEQTVKASVDKTVHMIKSHPFLCSQIKVTGLILHLESEEIQIL